ncbi:MAG TPA: hypothetical protein VHF22_04635 [Planctomycetota bacterium]|nr:hypothetical protein [Planctomycetota bacterium]
MPTPTSLRVLKDVVVAVNHQADFSTPAATGSAQPWQVLSCEIDPGYEYIHPRGTDGSYRPKDTHTKVAQKPKATVEFLGTPKALPFAWEYTLGGQTLATQADGDVTKAGDTDAALSAFVLNGVRPGFNTSADFKLYAKYEGETPGAGSARVSLYSDAARTQLVAQGSGLYTATVALAAQNGSGLSGSIALASVTASNLAGIVLAVVSVRPQESGVLSRWFSLWRDHGPGAALERLTGCAVAKLTRTSEQLGAVRYKLELVAQDYHLDTAGGGTLTPGLAAADLQYQLHGTLTLHTDTGGANVAQNVLKLEFAVENDLEVIVANATEASAILKKGVKSYPLTFTQKLSDEAQVVLARGVADSYDAVTFVDAYAAKTATFVLPKVKDASPRFPSTKEEAWDEVEHRMIAVESTPAGTAPLAVTLVL